MKKVIFGLLLIASILWLPPAKSATLEEVVSIIREVENNCLFNHVKCKVKLIDSKGIVASTNYSTITLSMGTIKFFPKDELRSVAYHELAHALLQHSNQIGNYRDNIRYRLDRDLNYKEEQGIRHRVETEADTFSSFLLYINNKPNRLDKALRRIHIRSGTPADMDTLTHPSLNKRLSNIRRLKILYGN